MGCIKNRDRYGSVPKPNVQTYECASRLRPLTSMVMFCSVLPFQCQARSRIHSRTKQLKAPQPDCIHLPSLTACSPSDKELYCKLSPVCIIKVFAVKRQVYRDRTFFISWRNAYDLLQTLRPPRRLWQSCYRIGMPLSQFRASYSPAMLPQFHRKQWLARCVFFLIALISHWLIHQIMFNRLTDLTFTDLLPASLFDAETFLCLADWIKAWWWFRVNY